MASQGPATVGHGSSWLDQGRGSEDERGEDEEDLENSLVERRERWGASYLHCNNRDSDLVSTKWKIREIRQNFKTFFISPGLNHVCAIY